MLIGNKLYKHNSDGEIVRLTTDDIIEGEANKFCLEYPDGKKIGDIILRFSPEDIPAHHRLTRLPSDTPETEEENYRVYEYEAPDFYAYCLERKNAIATELDTDPNYYYGRTEEDYELYLTTHSTTTTLDEQILQEPYCPYFVLHYATMSIYQVQNSEGDLGYTPVVGTVGTQVESGYIYADTKLTEVLTINYNDWRYTDIVELVSMNYVHLPTLPSYSVGNTKAYYYVITKSRVYDNAISIRTVNIANTITLPSDQQAYVKNLGNQRNLDLEFGVPSGVTPTISIGEVTSGTIPAVTTSGTERDVVFNFTFPKGDKGDAGGVIVLDYINDTPPSTGNLNELFYNTSNNIIYIYRTRWEEYLPAVKGMIYLNYNVCYYFTGTKLEKTYAQIQVNTESARFDEGMLEVVGVRSKERIGDNYTAPGTIRCDWVGTEADWDFGRANGLIPDEYICYIIDD